jgi:DNA-binding NarL/FixJ family response regulator
MKQIRVVVAEDSAHFRQSLVKFFDHLPRMKVVGEAADGEAALRYVNDLAPDLLLLDIRMPKLDGLQVLEQLQTWQTRVTVLVLSAYPSPVFASAAMARGATAFIAKGDMQGLVDALDSVAADHAR